MDAKDIILGATHTQHTMFRLHRCLAVHPSICRSVYLSDCLSVRPSVCLSIHPSIRLSMSIHLPHSPINPSIHTRVSFRGWLGMAWWLGMAPAIPGSSFSIPWIVRLPHGLQPHHPLFHKNKILPSLELLWLFKCTVQMYGMEIHTYVCTCTCIYMYVHVYLSSYVNTYICMYVQYR